MQTPPLNFMPGPHRILYEFNLTCGHKALVEVDRVSYEPIDPETGQIDRDGAYTCPVCGGKERP